MIEIVVAGLMGFVLGWVGQGRVSLGRMTEQRAVWQARTDAVQAELLEAREEIRSHRARLDEGPKAG
ncbi:MAG: hypothetical protein MJB57_03430 [Gemmatimonadetes bacterium]|nr:hypothetical protein [Gemmatimonadota bacterium]